MKKKILAIVLCIAMLAIAIVGGTLAYFTDTDAQTNVFTVGNIKIDLFEDFNSENLPLIPAVGTMDETTGYATFENAIEKEVYVTNTGDQKAYVRLHIAVPAFTRGEKNINVLNLMYDEYTTVDGEWIWGTTVDTNYPIRDGGDWNMYRDVEIRGVPYKVFVVTYETALESGETTPDAINKVYMDSLTTQEEIAAWNAAYMDEGGSPIWARIYVVAEAAQADGFADAVTALNTTFGVPGEYDVDFLAAPEGDTFKEWTSNDGTN